MSHEKKVSLVDRTHPDISISQQALLMGVSRASLYYKPILNPGEVRITRAIDELYTRYPFYGSRRMKDILYDDYAIHIGRHQNCCSESSAYDSPTGDI